MKKYLLVLVFLVAYALGCWGGEAVLIFAQPAPGSSPAPQAKSTSILLVERDVPQTRTSEFVPIVNHEALIANLSDETIKIEIESPVPRGFYVVKEFYPAFGYDSLLSVPMYFPQDVKISDYKVLERPSVEKKNAQVIYRWAEVSIPPQQAVIAQYDNYSGDLSQFYTPEGLKVLDLYIYTSYRALQKEGGKAIDFELNYELINKGKEEIEDVLMDIILPDIVYTGKEMAPLKLFEVTETFASREVKIDRGLLGDGFGNVATGTIFFISIDKIKPGEKRKLTFKVKGKKEAERGESYPLLTFQYRMKGSRIWPSTVVKSKQGLEITKFYYRQCNLILPDGKLFRLSSDKVEVVPTKGLLE